MFTVHTDGSNLTQLTAIRDYPHSLTFSPDGTQLLYSREVNGDGWELYIPFPNNDEYFTGIIDSDGQNSNTLFWYGIKEACWGVAPDDKHRKNLTAKP